jgi:predicted metal-dependent phosphoesterase TrpH
MSPRSRAVLALVCSLAVLSTAIAWQSSTSAPDRAGEVIPPLRDNGPRYWKGNLHTHSYWSDGDDFPEMIADWYKRHGYHFLTLSDHNVLSEGERWLNVTEAREESLEKYRARFGDAWVEQRKKSADTQVRLKPLAELRSVLEEPGRFLLIPGEEISHRYGLRPVHMNAINLRDVVRPVNGPNVAETVTANLRLVAEHRKKTGWKTLVSLNHPNFGWGIRAEDMLAEELRFFEVFNGHPSVRNYGDKTHAGTERIWDIILATRLGKLRLPIVYALATDDAHSYHKMAIGKANPGRAWVMVRAPFLSAEAIVRAMEAGDFYASSGVTLSDVRRKGGQLSIAIQAEPGVRYRTQFIATMRDAPLHSEPVLDADGNELAVTRRYSPEVGKVIAETDVLQASYTFTGKELYVRARVVSTKPHPNPYQKDDTECAWTQPMMP